MKVYFFFNANGYFPSPFFVDKSNCFMDFFNLIYAAKNDFSYTEYKSVYPPISFLLVKLVCFVFSECQGNVGEIIRSNSKNVIIFLILIGTILPFIINQTSIWNSYTKKTRFLIAFFFVTSFPYLFALERGNVILILPILLAVNLIKLNQYYKIFNTVLLINLKPYLLILSFPYFLSYPKKYLYLFLFALVTFFLVTSLVFDYHSYLILSNITDFSSIQKHATVRGLLDLSSSISSFSAAINSDNIKSKNLHLLVYKIPFFIESLKFITSAIFIFALLTRLRWGKLSSLEFNFAAIVLITNFTVSVGGYSLILYYPLIPIIHSMKNGKIYLTLIFLIFTPLNISLITQQIGIQHSFLSDTYVYVDWDLTIGSVFRPLLNFLLLLFVLSEIWQRKKSSI